MGKIEEIKKTTELLRENQCPNTDSPGLPPLSIVGCFVTAQPLDQAGQKPGYGF